MNRTLSGTALLCVAACLASNCAVALSQAQFDSIYSRLGTRFDHTLGESFYNPRLKPLVGELREKGIARESEGAVVIFFEDDPALKEWPWLKGSLRVL